MQLFTIPELAKQLGHSRQWLWYLVKNKTVPAKKVGGVYIIKQSDIPTSLLQNNNSQTQNTEVTNE